MESRTERVLRALGSREGFAVLTVLLEAETTQTRLRSQTKLAAQTLEGTLEVLSQGGLIERLPGSQGAWRVTHWPETFAVLRAARQLSFALAGTDDAAAERERELFNRLDQAGAARPAAKRGGRRTNADQEDTDED